jgi:hypothetical protein
VLTAGDPIPPNDERQITLAFLAIGRPSEMPSMFDLYSAEETLARQSSEEETIVDDLSFCLSALDKEECSIY